MFINMNFAGTSDIVDDLQYYTSELRKWVTELQTNSENALASWDGDAKAQYYVEKANWNQAIAEMEVSLQMQGEALYTIQNTTQNGEARNTQRFVNMGKV
jgi:uncharacterized protein YukE